MAAMQKHNLKIALNVHALVRYVPKSAVLVLEMDPPHIFSQIYELWEHQRYDCI